MILSSVILSMLIFVLCYQEGGQGPKWTRRFVGPIFLALTISAIGVIARNVNPAYYLGAWGLLAAANCFSYGEKVTHNKTALKILFRGLCGGSYGLCFLLQGLSTGQQGLAFLQLFVAVCASIFFGVFGPFPSSWGDWKTRAEDSCIALFYICLLPFILR